MIQPKAAPDDGLGQPELYRVGCIGEIVGLESLAMGASTSSCRAPPAFA
jgi:Lon protease-like protein